MKKRFLFLALVFLCLSGCRGSDQPIEFDQPINIPEADVVFYTIDEIPGEVLGNEILGFYSFDDPIIKKIDTDEELITPYYLKPDTIVALWKQGNPGLINEFVGKVFIFSSNNFRVCRSEEASGFNVHIHNGNILITTVYTINLVDSNDCSLIKTILNQEDLSNFEYKPLYYSSFDLAQGENFLIVSLNDREMIRIDLPEKNILDYKKIGMNPSISPNQSQIVYVGTDGIHTMDINGENDQLIISLMTNEDSYRSGIPPRPNWSSDGKKIIYHKCDFSSGQLCGKIDYYNIYLYDFETNTETLLIEHGINPSWGLD